MRQKFIISAAVLALAWAFFSMDNFQESTARAEEITKIIAKVNNCVITSKDLYDYCRSLTYRLGEARSRISCENEQVRKETLQRLIDDKLILDEAKRDELEISRSWVDEQFNKIAAAHPSHRDFERSLEEKGLTITLMKERIGEQYLMRQTIGNYVKSFVKVSPQEISRYYQDNPEKCYSDKQFVFYLVQSDTRAPLESIYQIIKEKGISEAEKFHGDSLIKLKSQKAELKEEIATILEESEEGDLKIARFNEKFCLIYLDEIIPTCLLSLEEIKEEIHSYLWQRKFKRKFTEWLKELRAKAVIEICHE